MTTRKLLPDQAAAIKHEREWNIFVQKVRREVKKRAK